MNWRPRAGPEAWQARATLLATIRGFFKARSILEVQTPLLAPATVTDPHLQSFHICGHIGGARQYLQTSPEYAMKRLLAAGSGPIYQICPAFRNEPPGRLHNPEFTLVEWYRPGFSLEDLMAETGDLLAQCLETGTGRRLSYRQAFSEHLNLDPFSADAVELANLAAELGLVNAGNIHRDGLLEFLFSASIQPRLGPGVVFVHDYPPGQAALSRIRPGPSPVARRVEVFIDGLELANGYEELLDPAELSRRWQRDRRRREAAGLDQPLEDELLLAAMEQGLPESAGIALGLDRLLMLKLGVDSMDQVLNFPQARQ